MDKKMLIMSGGANEESMYVPQTLKAMPDGTYAPVVQVANFDTREYSDISIQNGIGFAWSSTVIPGLSVATNLRAYMENPTGSGKTVQIYSFVVDNGATSPIYATLRLNPN
jgi:hypothetical protein